MILETLTLVAFAAPQAALQIEPERVRVLRVVPLAELTGAASIPRPVPLPPFVRNPESESLGGLLEFSESGPRRVDADAVAAVLFHRFRGQVDDERLSCDVRRKALLLGGDAEVVEEAVALVSALSTSVAPRLRVEAWVLEVDDAVAGDRASPVFGPNEAPSIDGARWRASAVVRAGQPVELSEWHRTPLIYEVNTEVAQDSSISNPVIGVVGEGVRVVVEAHVLSGSNDLVVFGQAAICSLREPIRSQPTGVPGQQSIDIPVLADHAATFSARTRNGGGVVVWHAGRGSAGGRQALVVRIERVPGGEARQPDGCTVLPVGALTRAGIRHGTLASPDAWGEEFLGFPLVVDAEVTGSAAMDFDEITYLVERSLGEAYDEDRVSLLQLGGCLVLLGDAEARARAEALVSGLEDELLETVGVVLRTEAVAGPGSGAPIHELAFPALCGRPHLALRGIETTGIGSFWSEIAQEAAILNPGVEPRFAGLVASVLPSRAVDGVHVDARIDLIGMDPTHRRALEGELGGELSIATQRHARFTHDAVMKRGEVVRCGDGPVLDGVRTVQTLQIR